MVRYLIYFQYIGTKYCGVVRASKKTTAETGLVGVQDVIENALEKLNPYQPPKIFVSSRTDSGVHALCNAAHFDLVRPPKKPPVFNLDGLRLGINCHIGNEPVRIIKAVQVPEEFHSQHLAVSRRYLYRIATGCYHRSLPVTEMDRCWAVKYELNVEAMREASQIFLGTHDFSAFRSSSKESVVKSPIKTIDSIEIAPSQGFLSHHYGSQYSEEIKFLEVVFRSRSFLYRQIRRMVSALVSVGLGHTSKEDLQEVLDSRNNDHVKARNTAPPSGLYLVEVSYNERDLHLHHSDQLPSKEDKINEPN
ncbi:tRNA pseudouridine synthase-like 1 [Asterias rubens]|uniref:tRNA pseudouridine synthase-like 1 n=1 Tax=Asterias rubens TaxID=7604 RepID=UPI0014551914|nr:tRNA pseudouridine synthase-like 1 [Asterias rubens]